MTVYDGTDRTLCKMCELRPRRPGFHVVWLRPGRRHTNGWRYSYCMPCQRVRWAFDAYWQKVAQERSLREAA